MKKIRVRKKNHPKFVFIGILLLFFTLSIGYSILTTNLTFSITATKNPTLILNDMMDRYQSRFYFYDGIYYNQGNSIYIKFNNQNWQILSVDTAQHVIKILSPTLVGPLAFRNTCPGDNVTACSNYGQHGSIGPSSLYNLVSFPNISGTESKYIANGQWYWGGVSPWGSDFTQKGLVDQVKERHIYGNGGSLSIEDYVMRIPEPSNPTKLESYQNAMNYLGFYYYNLWLVNNNGSSPITYEARSGNMSNLAEPTISDRYRAAQLVYIRDTVKLGSGIGTSQSPYVIKG